MTEERRLRERLETALREALRARDRVAVAALRSAVSAIDNAGAVEGPSRFRPRLGVGAADVARRELSLHDVEGIVRAEIADRVAAAADYERLGRAGEANRLLAEAAVLESHLDGT